ncbi:MAG: Uncharacterized protein FD145_131 [Candidatus Saganbacteria bacterium]|uniref:SbsA Ig-like domain-containing protein n=1 Tax=Candidatus Saganbacteria bacterium TaxID=2575572 RepID=A0A833L2J8_UNCSA|nr:MAG: Uncharacterized protein FD145_131 [Candidatus Saganbacteria bacterium]
MAFLALSLNANGLIYEDSSDNIYLIHNNKINVSQDLGKSWILQAPISAEAAICERSDKKALIFYVFNNSLFLKDSANLKESKNIYTFASSPESSLAYLDNNTLNLFYLKNKYLFYAQSTDYGNLFSQPQAINNNIPVDLFSAGGNTLAFASNNRILLVKSNNGWELPAEIYQTSSQIQEIKVYNNDAFWIEKAKDNKYSVFMRHGNKQQIIHESYDQIKGIDFPVSNTMSFYLNKNNVSVPFFLTIGDNNYSKARQVKETMLDGEAYLGIISISDVISSAWIYREKVYFEKLKNNPPAILSFDFPKYTNLKTFKYKIGAIDDDADPISYGFEIYKEAGKILTISTSSAEGQIFTSLSDGKYTIKAIAKDAVSQSTPTNAQEINIDTIPPYFKITEPENGSIVNINPILVKGEVAEEAKISINSVLFERTGLTFSKSQFLVKGENIISITLTDEAGNSAQDKLIITYNPDAPILKVNKPQESGWYKGGSTIYLEVETADNDIVDETEVQLAIDGQALDQTLTYYLEDKKASGFVSLPKLSQGIHKLRFLIKDANNNAGSAFYQLKIDALPPMISQKDAVMSFGQLTIPFEEKESGIDISGTSLNITCGSSEVAGKINHENGNIVFKPKSNFLSLQYKVSIKARDLAGNIANEESFTISPNNSTVSILQNAGELSILSLINGPNPFSPIKDITAVIKYLLSKTGDIKLFIYNIDGSCIFIKEVKQTSSGSVSWDGKDLFGQAVPQGVYPYLLFAKDNIGKSEVKRGNIIVLQ